MLMVSCVGKGMKGGQREERRGKRREEKRREEKRREKKRKEEKKKEKGREEKTNFTINSVRPPFSIPAN